MTVASAPTLAPSRTALAVGLAAMFSLAVAMGVGRFAFTPLYPLMAQDGLLSGQGGALLASANYFGYLVGALLAAHLTMRPARLMAVALVCTVIVTAAMGWTTSLAAWAMLRFIAGVLSAWALVATSAWGLAWLAALGRPQLAGAVYAGVGLGIAGAGAFCLLAAKPGVSSLDLWIEVAALTGAVVLVPLIVLHRLAGPPAAAGRTVQAGAGEPPLKHADDAPPVATPAPGPGATTGAPAATARASDSMGLGIIICYSLYGLGYILPATYLPAMARNLIADPRLFGRFVGLRGPFAPGQQHGSRAKAHALQRLAVSARRVQRIHDGLRQHATAPPLPAQHPAFVSVQP